MTEQRKPIARLTYRADKVTYGILAVWPGKFPGTYDISREKGSDKRQAISFGDALRKWTSGEGYLSFTIESQREKRDEPRQPQSFDGGFGGGFGDDDISF